MIIKEAMSQKEREGKKRKSEGQGRIQKPGNFQNRFNKKPDFWAKKKGNFR